VSVLGKVDGVVPGHEVGLCFAFTGHDREYREELTAEGKEGWKK
jgi:hypothetical protein